jgi:hypothetical protein
MRFKSFWLSSYVFEFGWAREELYDPTFMIGPLRFTFDDGLYKVRAYLLTHVHPIQRFEFLSVATEIFEDWKANPDIEYLELAGPGMHPLMWTHPTTAKYENMAIGRSEGML